MKTEILTLCDYAQDNNGKLTIVGTFNIISSLAFPFTQTLFYIVARVAFEKGEIGDFPLKCSITDYSSNKELASLSGTCHIAQPDKGFATLNILFPIPQLSFSEPGSYHVILSIGESSFELPLTVVKIAESNTTNK